MNLEEQKQLIDKLHKELEVLKSQIKQKTKAIKKAQNDGIKLLRKWHLTFASQEKPSHIPHLPAAGALAKAIIKVRKDGIKLL